MVHITLQEGSERKQFCEAGVAPSKFMHDPTTVVHKQHRTDEPERIYVYLQVAVLEYQRHRLSVQGEIGVTPTISGVMK